LLLADFEKWIRPATDEFIRWGTTTPTMRRTTIKPGKIGDQTIEPGEKVVLFYNSSNRDERVFREPYAFDIGRSPNPHQGLGGGGPHFCLGAHLGKAELRAIFRELLARLPNIQVGEPDYYVGDVLQGIKRMACHF
jgi:cytochrome P450